MRMTKRRTVTAAVLAALALATDAAVRQADAQEAGAQTQAGDSVVALEARPPKLAMQVGAEARVEIVGVTRSGARVAVQARLVGPRSAVRIRQGAVSALAPGAYELAATYAAPGRSPLVVAVPVEIGWPAVRETRVSIPLAAQLPAGVSVQARAEVVHADGTRRPRPQAAWRSEAPGVAVVDRFGRVTGVAPGQAWIAASVDGVEGRAMVAVAPFEGRSLDIEGVPSSARTGDVVRARAVVRDAGGAVIAGVPVQWSHAYDAPEGAPAPPAAAQMREGRFVADVPGVHTIVATAGGLGASESFEVAARDVVQRLEIEGHGREQRVRTTDFWVFEGRDGRDYALTGAKRADGHGFVWDVTGPGIFKTDSIQVDARSVNDVKVSPDARYATLTREGASDRRNGVVILDLADPAHPVVASEVSAHGLTGGVHNAFPTETHVYALANGDKYVVLDVTDLYNPRYVGEYDHPDSRLHDVWVMDGLAYSAEWETGLVVVDVGDGRWGGSPENPVFVSSYPLPTGSTHAVFPYVSQSTGKHYVFVGDEIMNRRDLAWAGPGAGRGSYQLPYDPESGAHGIPLATQGYVQIIDFSDPENPEMVARYEVPEYGTHNIWVEDDKLYQAYYEGGLRIVDVSGELMGNLYTQGREIAVFKPFDPVGYIPNSPMTWSAMPFKGRVFFSDTNSGLWSARLMPKNRPVS